MQARRTLVGVGQRAKGNSRKHMTTLSDLNSLWPADANASPWVATPDGSWTRLVGAGINPGIATFKEKRRNAPAEKMSAQSN